MRDTVEGVFCPISYFQATWRVWVLAPMAMAVVIIALFAPHKPGQEALAKGTAAVFALVALGLLGYLVLLYLRRTRRVEVGPDGLVWEQGGQTGSANWGDVVEIRRLETYVLRPGERRSDWNRSAKLQMVLSGGISVCFHQSLDNYDTVVAAIQQRAAEVMLPTKLAEASGPSGSGFGPVVVRSEGVQIHGRLLPWAEINYGISNGWLVVVPNRDVFEDEERTQVELNKTPNYLVMLELMARLGKPPVPPLMVVPPAWREHMAKMENYQQ